MALLTTSLLSAVVLAHNPSLSVPSSPSELTSLERVPLRVETSIPSDSTHFHGYFVDVRDLREGRNARNHHRAGFDLGASTENDLTVDAVDLDSQAGRHAVASGGAVVVTPVGAQLRSGLNFEAPSDGGAPTASKGHWWSLHIAPGVGLLFGGGSAAAGPSLRLGGHVHKWLGKFYIAGGPQMHYGSVIFPGFGAAHFITFGGDAFFGGGNEKIVGYGHVALGLGAGFVSVNGLGGGAGFAGRAAFGGGLHGFVTPRFSMGFLTDLVVLGSLGGAGLGLDILLTMGVHFR